MSSSSSILAICSGPTVTTWDFSQSIQTNITGSSLRTTSASSIAKELLDLGIIRQFQPHGDDGEVIVSDLTWNHNGNVLATCSSSSWLEIEGDDKEKINHNVVLSNAKTGAQLDSFSNFLLPGKQSNNIQQNTAATSISFEGTGGKSRYLCLADEGGIISIWDMKKNTRARCFRLGSNRSISSISSNYSSPSSKTKNTNLQHSCFKAFIDPTDKFVAALSGYDGSLHMYYLRQGKLASVFRHNDNNSSNQTAVGAKACQFSSLNTNQVVVGNNEGNLLVWDVNSINNSSNNNFGTPLFYLPNAHEQSVTDVACSPTNARLITSASLDGNIVFHDIHMRQPIQKIPMSSSSSIGVTSIAFHADNATHFAAGTTNGVVALYDLRNATQALYTLNLSSQTINQLQFSPHNVSLSSKTITSTTHTSSHSNNRIHSKKPVSTSSNNKNNKIEAPSKNHDEALVPKPSLDGMIDEKNLKKKMIDTTPVIEATPHKTIPSQSYTHSTKSLKSSAEKLVNSMKISSEKMLSSVIPKKSSGSDESVGGIYKGPSPFVSLKSKIINNNSNQEDNSTLVKNLFQKTSSPIKHDSNPIISSKQNTEEKSLFFNYDDRITDSKTTIMNNIKQNISSVSVRSSPTDDNNAKSTKKTEERKDHETKKNYGAKSPHTTNNNTSTVLTNAKSDINSSIPCSHLPNANYNIGGVSEILMMSKQDLDDAIDDSIDYLREDFDSSLKNLHMDMLRQFQQQSDEMTALFAKQQVLLEQVLEENRLLRNENLKLRDRK